MTSPPLISFLAALVSRLRGSRLVLWMMDVNPDEAVAAAWLRRGSLAEYILDWCLRYSLRRADRIVALDRFMKERLDEKIDQRSQTPKVVVIPPWSHDSAVRYDVEGRDQFRRRHGLEGKFVVMYSGNHSPCHPLHTLLEAARRLSDRADIAFCWPFEDFTIVRDPRRTPRAEES